ncbi:hypothetical protein SCFA_2870002 [anaerobic digester metagenome]|jgi:hypothetical protein|uniref:Uncharacterized protein n=1 Tax=anaerobic digester metagenome TaxID=1263854 RepID=A0A485M1C1_9ZZZZ
MKSVLSQIIAFETALILETLNLQKMAPITVPSKKDRNVK